MHFVFWSQRKECLQARNKRKVCRLNSTLAITYCKQLWFHQNYPHNHYHHHKHTYERCSVHWHKWIVHYNSLQGKEPIAGYYMIIIHTADSKHVVTLTAIWFIWPVGTIIVSITQGISWQAYAGCITELCTGGAGCYSCMISKYHLALHIWLLVTYLYKLCYLLAGSIVEDRHKKK